jgi:hypothetical protein
MNRSHVLCHDLDPSGEDLSPAEVVRRLRKAFPLVHVNYHLGGYRNGQRICRLRKAGAPEVVLQSEEQRRQEALQVSVFDGERLTQVLDLTVHHGWVRAYHTAGAEDFVRRAAVALGYEVEEDKRGGDDERESREERRHWARVRKCRDTMAALRGAFEGAEALYVHGSNVSRVRVHTLEISEPRFSPGVQPLPTRGLQDLRGPFRLTWWWDEFTCGPEFWARGPMIVETFHFGEAVEVAVRYCESLADPEFSPNRRQEIAWAVRNHQKEALAPYLKGSLDLFWNKTRIGLVSEHRLDDFPQVHSKLLETDLSTELRKALEWWAQEVGESLDKERERVEQPFTDELLAGWWLQASDGSILEISYMPVVDFREQTIEWDYSRRTSRRT